MIPKQPNDLRGPVLVVGDLICDRYLWGDVERISPEAPVPVLQWQGEAERAGGAANVALNLAALGCEVIVAGVVGRDSAGRWLLRTLERRGVRTDAVIVSSERATIRKLRIVARGQQLLRVDQEDRDPVPGSDARALVAALKPLVRRAAGIICSDYGKGALSPAVLDVLLKRPAKRARGRQPRVLVDPMGSDYSRYRGADILTPNEKELAVATVELNGADLAVRAERVRRVSRVGAILITRGARGMDLFEFGRGRTGRLHVPAFQAHEVYDVTGAGDTVAAVMGLSAFRGLPLAEAARLATVAAGVVVSQVGTAVVDAETLTRITQGSSAASGAKILPRNVVRARVQEARTRGARVVFTNGCFDVLHTGHLHLLQRARALGDVLVVGINHDRTVRRLKGPDRPLVGHKQRAEVLAGLGCVDYVTVFSEPTPLRLIKSVKPDVLAKGADYTISEVVGREAVETAGGRVELIPLLPGFSTSALARSLSEGRRASQS
jgi:D-beta-D-heptose 7-phosphate kinase/D-beta-D-heptose 1-phosphate adenosyltransferase